MTGLLSAWIAEMVLITYRGSKSGSTASNPIPHLSLPSEYASSFIIYGALAFVPGEGQRVATAIGWGLVVATLLNLYTPGSKTAGFAATNIVATPTPVVATAGGKTA